MRRRVLVAHPYVGSVGGGQVVAAWTLQALREEFDVILATLGPVDCEGLNRNFGTSLRAHDFDLRIAPPRHRAPLHLVPTQGGLLEIAVTTRWTRALAAIEKPDVLLSTSNEMDFGRKGLQYIHYPWAHMPRPDVEMKWFHHVPGFLPAYRGFCHAVAGGTRPGRGGNLCLANSEFVAGKIKEFYGVESQILYPPVPGNFPAVPWEQRRSAVVAIGRMHFIKRWEMALEIVERVRSRGEDLGLTLITQPDDVAYGRRIGELAASRPWVRLSSSLSREDLAREVAQHRYGIHTMEAEHFGIAVAELVRAGCIPFVHDSGGPREIVGGIADLRFDSVESGASKIATVLADRALQRRLLESLASRRDLFTAETFCKSLLQIVRSYCD